MDAEAPECGNQSKARIESQVDFDKASSDIIEASLISHTTDSVKQDGLRPFSMDKC